MQKLIKHLRKIPNDCWQAFVAYYRASVWHKIVVLAAIVLLAGLGGMYGVARWYIAQNQDKPMVMGVSFIPAYADSLGLDPQETMDALINDLGVKHFRLVSYWNQLEPEPGKYDFSLLDWQFQKAENAEAKVTLSIGLRQPRWPECHIPDWAEDMPRGEWQPRLESFMREVITRYKDSPALESYQLENEYFLEGFGHCKKFGFSRDRLIREANIVRQLDPWRPLIMSRSNNIAITMPLGQPRPDTYGISVYKRVWDSTVTKRYLEYPFPAWYYAFEAGMHKILTGKETIIHELQAEAWPPEGKFITHIDLAEQDKSFNAERFRHRLEFGRATGMREMYLWGAEYWYYRMMHENDPSLWVLARDAFSAEEDR